MNKKDTYIWTVIIVVAVVAIAAIYFETVAPTGKIDVALNAPSSNTTYIYPYQSVFVPVMVSNYGSSVFRNLDVGVFINGNLTGVYNVTLPQGNRTEINFSKEFTTPGTFNVSFAADPGNLYTLQNRSKASASFVIVVQKPDAPEPYAYLPSNQISENDAYISSSGYLTMSYLKDNYSVDTLSLSSMPVISAFFARLLNLTYSYVQNIYSAEATYKNASAYSIWIQGPFVSNITAVFAKGLNNSNITISYENARVGTVDIINFGGNTTLCSWYSGGWVKSLAYEGSASCAGMLNGNGTSIVRANTLPGIKNSSVLANFSSYSRLGYGTGRILSYNSSILYESDTPNVNPDYTCYGEISSVNNVSYCSTYLFQKSGKIGKLSVIRTSSFRGQQNLTAMSLVNTSLVPYQIYGNIGILQSFNASGVSSAFRSGINSTCSLNASFSCFSPTLALGNMTLRFYNRLNYSVDISTMYCHENGASVYSPVNKVMRRLSYENVTIPCYDNGNVIAGIPLGLNVKIGMNYSIGVSNYTAAGSAYVV